MPVGASGSATGPKDAQWRVPREVWATLGHDLLPEGWTPGAAVPDIPFLRTDPRVADVGSGAESWLYRCIGGGEGSAAAQAALDNWLTTIPDQPTVPGLVRAADSNSLLSQTQQYPYFSKKILTVVPLL